MFPTPFRFAHTLAHQMPDVCRTLLYPNFGINLDRFWEFTFVGGFSPTLSGEIGLSEIRIVFAEVSICPERTELLQRSLRETHFEATVTRFESAPGFPPIPGESSVGTFFRGHEKGPQKSLVSTPRVRWGEQGRQHARRAGF